MLDFITAGIVQLGRKAEISQLLAIDTIEDYKTDKEIK